MNIQRLSALSGLALAGGCLVDDPLPWLGECAVHPEDGWWEYGQVGIGTCLGSPSDLQVRPDPATPGGEILWLVNSNARGNFSGSSLLAIDLASVDLSCPANGLHEVEAAALGMQEFAGRVAFDDRSGLALLSSRQRAGREGDLTDVLYFIDASDPRALSFSDEGPRSFGPYRWMQVPSDPWAVRFGPDDGRAYVLGLTTHTISAIDLVPDPAQYLDLRGERSVSAATFEDLDGSGSDPDWKLLGTQNALLANERVWISAVGGTTRLFGPTDDGALQSWDGVDGQPFVAGSGGPAIEPEAVWAEGGFTSISVALSDGSLLALAAGFDSAGTESIGRLSAEAVAVRWDQGSVALAPAEAWEAGGVSEPDWIRLDSGDHLFYAAGPAGGRAIGHAQGSALASFERVGSAGAANGLLITPQPGAWDGASVYGPAALERADTGRVLLYFSGHDGTDDNLPQGIGLAEGESPESVVRTTLGLGGTSLVLEPGPPGAWDAAAVGWPSVLYAEGRFHLYYQGFDGTSWATGHATSFDGRTFEKDADNPILAGGVEPVRHTALRVTPSGEWRVQGEWSGLVTSHATSGEPFLASSSPVQFRIVDGPWLGVGEPGATDEDGALDPAAPAGETLLYVGDQDGLRRLHHARVEGGRTERAGAVTWEGFAPVAAGIDGPTPTAWVRHPEHNEDGTVLVAEVAEGIVIGTWDGSGTVRPLGTGLALSPGASGAADDARVGAPALVVVDGRWHLFHDAGDGSTTRIALATSDDGITWTRDGVVFDRGGAGAWDDAWVGRPSVLWDEQASLFRLWYLGSDGQDTRLGYAESADGRTWSRHRDSAGSSVPIFDGSTVSFSDGRIDMPSVRAVEDGYELWFGAPLEGQWRVGRARSGDGLSFAVVPNVATAGDRFEVRTAAGDTDASSAIELGDDRNQPRYVDGYAVHGAGATEMILSPDGGMAIVANKRAPFLLVADLRDDSGPSFDDANAFDLEAMIRLPQRAGLVGVRDLAFSPDGSDLWVLLGPLVAPESPEDDTRRGPEALLRIAWDRVGDEAVSRALLDDVVETWTPLPRGVEEDLGYATDISGGPTALTLSADGRWAYVPNYNQNSLSIIQLDAGARPVTRRVVQNLDETPYDVALSHGGRVLWVANNFGVARDGAQHSTVQAIDVDPSSATYGTVLTRLSNLESRSDHGCP